MARTYKQILRQLPLDDLLEQILDDCGFVPPEEINFDGNRDKANVNALLKALDACEDQGVISNVAAKILKLEDFNFRFASQSIFDVFSHDPRATEEIDALCNGLHRALWLFVRHPGEIQRVKRLMDFDKRISRTHRVCFNHRKSMIATAEARSAFGHELQESYKKSLGCGKFIKVDVTPRNDNVTHVYAYVQGLSETVEEFKNGEVTETDIFPPLTMSMQYSKDTGILEVSAKGSARYKQLIVKAFSKHFFQDEVAPELLQTPELNLSSLLKTEISLPANSYGAQEIQVKRLSFLTDAGLRIVIENTLKSQTSHDNAYDLFAIETDDDMSVLDLGTLESAYIKLHLANSQGYFPGEKTIPLTLSAKGHIGGMDKFSETEKSRIRDILIGIGVMQADVELGHEVTNG